MASYTFEQEFANVPSYDSSGVPYTTATRRRAVERRVVKAQPALIDDEEVMIVRPFDTSIKTENFDDTNSNGKEDDKPSSSPSPSKEDDTTIVVKKADDEIVEVQVATSAQKWSSIMLLAFVSPALFVFDVATMVQVLYVYYVTMFLGVTDASANFVDRILYAIGYFFIINSVHRILVYWRNLILIYSRWVYYHDESNDGKKFREKMDLVYNEEEGKKFVMKDGSEIWTLSISWFKDTNLFLASATLAWHMFYTVQYLMDLLIYLNATTILFMMFSSEMGIPVELWPSQNSYLLGPVVSVYSSFTKPLILVWNSILGGRTILVTETPIDPLAGIDSTPLLQTDRGDFDYLTY